MKITRAEADLIRNGFAIVAADRAAAAQSFYAHLFRIAPETRDLFVVDMAQQGKKLMDTLAVIVDLIERWGMLRTELEGLALRHLAYGVRPEHYAATGAALLAMLQDRLGPKFTPGMADAWRRAYEEIRDTMISSAYGLPDGDAPDRQPRRTEFSDQ